MRTIVAVGLSLQEHNACNHTMYVQLATCDQATPAWPSLF